MNNPRSSLKNHPAKGINIQPGGQILVHQKWETVFRVTREDGQIISITTFDDSKNIHTHEIETITKYKAPTAEQAALYKKIPALPRLVNYPGYNFIHMTKTKYNNLPKTSKCTDTIKSTNATGRHRIRCTWQAREKQPVFITDSSRLYPPPRSPENG